MSKPPAPAPEPAPRKRPSASAYRRMALRVSQPAITADQLDPYRADRIRELHPPSAIPKENPRLAQDEGTVNNILAWAAADYIYSAFKEGTTFLGYPYLAVLAQRAEYRTAVETLASEMTREWIEFETTGEDKKTEQIKQIEDELKRLHVREAFDRWCQGDGFFGRGHLYLEIGGPKTSDDRDELKKPIGDGRDDTSQEKIGKDRRLSAIRPIEAVWCYPTNYESNDPLKEDWYRPNTWHVMGKEVHRTRLLTLVSREVPDLLKPAYSFGGLSLSQMMKPYVDNWLRTRQSIADLVHNFSVMVLATDVSGDLEEGGRETLDSRVDLFNKMRDNRGTFVIDKDSEDFKNVSAPISGLEGLQSQSQEHMSLPAGVKIETSRGAIPIERIRADDQVLTRIGYRPIKWSGITGTSAALVEIEAAGIVLPLTGNHPVWSVSTGEFVNAENVSLSHHLLALKTQNRGSTARRWPGAVTGGAVQNLATTAIKRLVGSCIELFGRRIGDLSRRAMNSITGTMMAATTNGTISSFSPAPSMKPGTMGLQIAASASATHAESNTRRSLPALREIAESVEVVAIERVSTKSVPRQLVYDIEVDGPPEFFANGILVHNCAVTLIPAVKLLGIQPEGFNASSEGEVRTFYDRIKASQEKDFREPLTTIIGLVQLSLFGKVDPEITFKFVDLWQLDEAGSTAVEKTKADIHDAYVAMGAIDGAEVREAIAKDPKSIYVGVDLSGPPPEPPGMAEPEPGEEHEDPEGGVPNTGAKKPNGRVAQFKPKDPGNALASGITNRAARFGGAGTGGFGGDVGPLKLAKGEVGYEHPAQGPDHCGICEHFSAPDRCVLVAGPIDDGDWCKLFAALPAGQVA